MLKLTMFEFVIRSIPEVFVFMFAAYAFSKTKIDKKIYILSSLLLAVAVFVIRALPINYGVHTILNISFMTIISNSINKIEIISSVKAAIIMAIILFASEGINVFILKFLLGDRLTMILSNPVLKTIYGLPSLLILASIVIGYYIFLGKRNKLRNGYY
ncbi:hypothetical protein [Clostridium celatum]|uniref:Uncharacterized protein n=1 Tax=Clostridium celatum DSM 1785 TaxID=545697 RepID=L1QLB1_9CLOT|nr:hypothetical protein [Clostridium celatum]EKY28337.1 hypothetical protein HMPREF0216_00859 [Clostridium celatum DSM 1785]MCE9655262.1 hypothetical protein [Clostridium celatum]MDU2265464.1 hypothetical protein [Clostridium celatum]MDU3723316.1 hypothetical protein [Clostridium celatum]MDU6295194.1 hypothetical protein [Clostridium celatum]